MTFGTLIYFFILLTGLLISVVCLQYGTVAVMGALIIVPVFMLAFLIVMRYHTTGSRVQKSPGRKGFNGKTGAGDDRSVGGK